MTKKIGAALAAILVSLFGALIATQQPAQASQSQCGAAYMCIWTNNLFGGSFSQQTAGNIYQAAGHCWKFPVGGTFDNSVSSYYMNFTNGTDTAKVHFFDNNSCSGTSYTQSPPGPAASMPSGWNDRLGSISISNS